MDKVKAMYTPTNSKTIATTRWRFNLVKECLGIIAMAPDQAVENRALARAVGQDPRALRQTLQHFPQIRIMIDPDGRRGLWYTLNPGAPRFEIPGNLPPPRNPVLIDAKTSDNVNVIECIEV